MGRTKATVAMALLRLAVAVGWLIVSVCGSSSDHYQKMNHCEDVVTRDESRRQRFSYVGATSKMQSAESLLSAEEGYNLPTSVLYLSRSIVVGVYVVQHFPFRMI